ncbi:MAG: tryptophan 7-halogenase [Candidatus Scalindua sp.]|nr:tryptophan 7-halogenase [Candidatus Scalindua sp.]MCR4344676.1 tryptophan 7-halogenase [Candidatus Scalindua sp.]
MPYDAVIIGGGPAGVTTAYYLVKAGLNPLVIEQTQFPRYCVGESLLPYNMEIFREMEFDKVLEKKGFMKKEGAVFGSSVSKNINRIDFSDGMEQEYSYAYQVPRDEFDYLLFEHVKEKGVEVLQGVVTEPVMVDRKVTGVKVRLSDKSERTIEAGVVVDASGRSSLLARKFNLLVPDPHIETFSVFGLFNNISWLKEAKSGDILILAFEHGWFWFIPFTGGRVSVGVVVDFKFYQHCSKDSPEDFFDMMIRSASGRVATLLENASRDGELHVLQKFSRYAKEKSGSGWVSIGDAAMFVDPVFSAGVFVAMSTGRLIASLTAEAISKNHELNSDVYKPYEDALVSAYNTVLPFIYHFRSPFFQKIFFYPPKDGKFVKLVVTILSGCFFKPELTDKDNKSFWKMVRLLEIKDKLVRFLKFHWLMDKFKSSDVASK